VSDHDEGKHLLTLPLRRALFLLLALVVTAAAQEMSPQIPQPLTTRTLTILHTGGLDGRLRAWEQAGAEIGGMARVVGLMRAAGEEALVVDTGDALGPAILSRFDSGRTMTRLLNSAGHAAMVPGNHDLSLHIDSLRARAAEADFAVLAANLIDDARQAPALTPYTVVERVGLRIGLIGLQSPELFQRVHADDRAGLSLTDPSAALSAALDSLAGRTDLTIVLAHMDYPELLAVARANDADLYIGGGYGGSKEPGPFLHAVQLGKGARLVSMPGSGYAGRIRVEVEQSADGWRLRATEPAIIHLDSTIAEDDSVAPVIAGQVERFRTSRAQVVGRVEPARDDVPGWVVRLMRRSAGVEAAFINRGTLRPVQLEGDIRQSTVDSLLRFHDDVVVLRLTGKQLKGLAADSKEREREGQQLIFAGYDPASNTINNRDLVDDEEFIVATTTFLAGGGDGYLSNVAARQPRVGRITLQGLASQAIGNGGRLPGIHPDRGRSAWLTTWKPRGTMTWINTFEHDGAGDVNNALAWNGVLEAVVTHVTPGRSLVNDFRTKFGQVRESGDLRESTDRIDNKTSLTWLRRGLSPFAAVTTSTEWTAQEGASRVLNLRGSSGLEKRLDRGKVSLGLGIERDWAADDTRIGLEMVPEYKLRFFGLELNSRAEVFYAATEQRFTVDNRNALTIDLPGDMTLSIDGDANFVWDGEQDRRVLSTELQMGLSIGFEWAGKVAR
jgi:5'-nucleotidase/UDP-sugar diphosphatase